MTPIGIMVVDRMRGRCTDCEGQKTQKRSGKRDEQHLESHGGFKPRRGERGAALGGRGRRELRSRNRPRGALTSTWPQRADFCRGSPRQPIAPLMPIDGFVQGRFNHARHQARDDSVACGTKILSEPLATFVEGAHFRDYIFPASKTLI